MFAQHSSQLECSLADVDSMSYRILLNFTEFKNILKLMNFTKCSIYDSGAIAKTPPGHLSQSELYYY